MLYQQKICDNMQNSWANRVIIMDQPYNNIMINLTV
nr:MAG TPA: hypothetical protein [Caudoviricetes sp.]